MTVLEKIKALFVWFFAPVIFVWRESIGLRGGQIRSLCVVACIIIMFRAFDRFRTDIGQIWQDPNFIIAVIAIATIALIAWGAQSAKLKVAQAQLTLGRQPTGSITDPVSPEIETDGAARPNTKPRDPSDPTPPPSSDD